MHPNQNAWAESQGSDSDNIWQISEDQYFKVDPRGLTLDINLRILMDTKSE